jgi:hypothetical protein
MEPAFQLAVPRYYHPEMGYSFGFQPIQPVMCQFHMCRWKRIH